MTTKATNTIWAITSRHSIMNTEQERILAAAIYEIRLLLAGDLGSTSESPLTTRIAAHIAYALHNEADAVLKGRTFDPAAAISKLKAIDGLFGTDDGSRLARAIDSQRP